MDDDRELVRLALEGDRHAYERLGIRIDQGTVRFFSRISDRDLAAELAQRTAIELLVKFEQRKNLPQGSLDGWIKAFAFTQLKQWFTSKQRERRRAELRSQCMEIIPTGPHTDEKSYAAAHRLQLVQNIIKKLPDKLYGPYDAHLDGRSYAEIAKAFRISESTARRRVHAAHCRVAKRWAFLRLTRTPFRTPPMVS